MRRAQLDRAERAEHVRPNLKHGPNQQHDRERLFHRADIHAQTAVGILFFHQFLCFIVKLCLRDDLLRFFHTFSSGARLTALNSGISVSHFATFCQRACGFSSKPFKKPLFPDRGKAA